ncbi:helix-turn-helix domain-containing protein [Agrobacterium tumefaciens]
MEGWSVPSAGGSAALFDIRSVGCLSVWERQYERGGLAALASRRSGGL